MASPPLGKPGCGGRAAVADPSPERCRAPGRRGPCVRHQESACRVQAVCWQVVSTGSGSCPKRLPGPDPGASAAASLAAVRLGVAQYQSGQCGGAVELEEMAGSSQSLEAPWAVDPLARACDLFEAAVDVSFRPDPERRHLDPGDWADLRVHGVDVG